MQFNFIWNASVSNAPSSFKSALISAGQQLASYFSDAITLNITVGWGETGGTPIDTAVEEASAGPLNGITRSYSKFLADLGRTSTTADDRSSVAFLQGLSDPTPGGTIYVSPAQEKVFGLLSPTSTALDGRIGFASTGVPWGFTAADVVANNMEDFNAVAIHEITHAMGRITGVFTPGLWGSFDLFQFSSPGTLQQVAGQAAYFSVDGGQTNLNDFDMVGDVGDWAESVVGDPFGEGSRGIVKQVSAVDLQVMDVLGFTLSSAGSAAARTITNNSPGAVVVGTAGDDIINAFGGNATISGQAGNDALRASAGLNTATYAGAAKGYTVTTTAGATSYTVQDRVGSDGRDTLTSIQKLRFADQTLDTTWFAKTAQLSDSQIVDLTELYIASFNRAPDALGLDYWGSRLHDGMSLADIAKSFFVQPEAAGAYPAGQSTRDFVTKVYNNVLNRGPDAGGLAYWTAELQNGHVSKDSFLLAIINGARAPSGGAADAQLLANKEAVGAHFALAQGLNDATWATAVMANVDATAASVAAANTLTDKYAAEAAAHGTELVVQILGIVA